MQNSRRRKVQEKPERPQSPTSEPFLRAWHMFLLQISYSQPHARSLVSGEPRFKVTNQSFPTLAGTSVQQYWLKSSCPPLKVHLQAQWCWQNSLLQMWGWRPCFLADCWPTAALGPPEPLCPPVVHSRTVCSLPGGQRESVICLLQPFKKLRQLVQVHLGNLWVLRSTDLRL